MKKTKIGITLIARYLLLIAFLNILSCGNSTDKSSKSADEVNSSDETKNNWILGYDFTHPDEAIILPAILHEISGITIIDSSSIACIQDENGIVFIYDVLRKEIREQISFYGNGDYEGITKTNGTIYVLRSNNFLYEIKNLESSDIAKEIRLLEIPHNESEGLCYDEKNHRLLIAPKDKADKDSDVKVKRGIYGFDLSRGELITEPVISFDLQAIKNFTAENNIFNEVKSKKDDKKDKPDINFKPSAIGIHPLTGKLFVLSAEDQMLYVFNLNGNIENIIRLDPGIFNMPEGIAFFRNGDMMISNEGQNSQATLIRLNYKSDQAGPIESGF